MTQPTPTPKREITVSERGEHVYFYLNSADAPSWFAASRGDNVQVLMAEAVLFTAAPQLLEACRETLDMLPDTSELAEALGMLPNAPELVATQKLRDQLQAAIDAATNAPVRDDKQETNNG